MSASLAAWNPTSSSVVTSEPDTPESDLVARSRAGNVAAFGQLYHRYENPVYRYAYHLLEDADDADDVRQETFVRAYQALARFRGEASFKTYLLTICSNLCRDRQRTRQRRPEREYGLTVPETSTHHAAFSGSENPLLLLERAAAAETVRIALRRLPPASREILLLRHAEELSIEEIAIILGCSRVNAPVRLFRARRQFKEIFLSLTKEEGE
jgi:RNA polymerase sigma-70 factor (ECF subfamily)